MRKFKHKREEEKQHHHNSLDENPKWASVCAVLCILISICVIVPILIFARYSVPAADDYSNAVMVQSYWDTYNSTVLAAIIQSIDLYKTTSGYYFAAFLNYFCSPFLRSGIEGLRTFNVIANLSFYMSVLLLCQVFTRKILKSRSILIFLALYAALTLALVNGYHNSEIYTWYVVLVAYISPLAIMLFSFSSLIVAATTNKLFYLFAAVGAFLVSGSSLNVTALNCGILFIIAVYFFLGDRKQKGPAVIFLCGLVGAILNIAAPGNYIRHDEISTNYGIRDAIISSTKMTIQSMADRSFKSIFLITLIIVFITAICFVDYSKLGGYTFKHPLAILGMSVIGTDIVNFPVFLGYSNQYFPHRCVFVQDLTMYILLIIWVIYLVGWIKCNPKYLRITNELSSAARVCISTSLLISACLVFTLFNGSLRNLPTSNMISEISNGELKRYVEYEEGIINEIKDSSQPIVVVNRNTAVTNDYCKDIGLTDNPKYWVNRFVAQYYGKEEVSLLID